MGLELFKEIYSGKFKPEFQAYPEYIEPSKRVSKVSNNSYYA